MRSPTALLCVAVLVGRVAAGAAPLPEKAPNTVPTDAYRLRMRIVERPEGIVVRSVEPKGPVTKMTRADNPSVTAALKIGDVITHMDGTPVTSLTTWFQALDRATANKGRVRLTVKDPKGGKSTDWIVQGERTVVMRPGPIPTPGRQTRRVKAVLVGLTDDPGIGGSVRADLINVQSALRAIPGFRGEKDLVLLEGRKVSAKAIREAIARLEVGPADTLFVYYSGHGAFDPGKAAGDPTRGHYLAALPGGSLPRRDLLGWMLARKARLTVLITDSCNVAGRRVTTPKDSMEADEAHKQVNTAFARLLLQFSGTVDVNSSSPGQYAWSSEPGEDESPGGWFTLSLLDTVDRWRPEEKLDWNAVLKRASDGTNAMFQKRKASILKPWASMSEGEKRELQKLRDQKEQRPISFTLKASADR